MASEARQELGIRISIMLNDGAAAAKKRQVNQITSCVRVGRGRGGWTAVIRGKAESTCRGVGEVGKDAVRLIEEAICEAVRPRKLGTDLREILRDSFRKGNVLIRPRLRPRVAADRQSQGNVQLPSNASCCPSCQ